MKTKPAIRKGIVGMWDLVRLLRQPMPDGLRWDWGNYRPEPKCGSIGCALGVMSYVLGNNSKDVPVTVGTFAAKHFGVSEVVIDDLFMVPPEGFTWDDEILATDVACSLERWLRKNHPDVKPN